MNQVRERGATQAFEDVWGGRGRLRDEGPGEPSSFREGGKEQESGSKRQREVTRTHCPTAGILRICVQSHGHRPPPIPPPAPAAGPPPADTSPNAAAAAAAAAPAAPGLTGYRQHQPPGRPPSPYPWPGGVALRVSAAAAAAAAADSATLTPPPPLLRKFFRPPCQRWRRRTRLHFRRPPARSPRPPRNGAHARHRRLRLWKRRGPGWRRVRSRVSEGGRASRAASSGRI
jgi:hypothetical protein